MHASKNKLVNTPALRHLLLSCLLLSACVKSEHTLGQTTYTGGKMHEQPLMAVFPDRNAYDYDDDITGALKDSLDKATRDLFTITKMPGITAAVLVPGKGLWQTNAGFIAKPEGTKVDANTVFYWASVTKMITATIISQLIREHKLTADSKLSTWFPQLQNAADITVINLLEHTSGIYSFNNDPATFSISRYYTPGELLGLSAAQKDLFSPGQNWSYSNTNYLLLALISEKIEGKSFAQIVQDRIASPLHLNSLKVLAPKERPVNMALAHANGKIVTEDYSVPLGAGDVVSNARDMVVLLYSLMAGKTGPVIDVYDRLRNLYPMPDKGMYYGNGIMLSDFNEITGKNDLWIGHTGGTETYRALVVYDTRSKTFIAIAVNAHVSVEACALKLLSLLKGA